MTTPSDSNGQRPAIPSIPDRPRNLFAQKNQQIQERLKELLAFPSEETQQALGAKHPGGLEIIESQDGRRLCVVVQYPIPESAVAKFKRHVNSGVESKVANAQAMLLGEVIVYPPENTWRQALAIEPALSDAFGQEVVRLSGAGATTEKKE